MKENLEIYFLTELTSCKVKSENKFEITGEW